MANFTVTNTNDSGSGSLRQAIQDANASEGNDKISFDSRLKGKTINLTSGQLKISSSIQVNGNIDGDSKADITIDSQSNNRVFLIDDGNNQADKDVKLRGLIIKGGDVSVNGAGISNSEKLALTNSHIQDFDSSEGAYGVGLDNSGKATVKNTSFKNLYSAGGSGVGINNTGTLTLTGGSFTRNSTYGSAPAIANSGRATIRGTTMTNNNSANGSGAIDNTGTLTVENSVISENSGDFGAGGALSNENGGKATVKNTVIRNNEAAYRGGGINNSGDLTVTNSSVVGNSTTGNSFDYGLDTYGGGIYNSGVVKVNNSTVSGNTASTSGSYSGFGGGIANFGKLLATNGTVSGNRATGGGSRGGGIFNKSTGKAATTRLVSTLVGDNSANSLPDIANMGANSKVDAISSAIEIEGNQVNGANNGNIFGQDLKLDPAGAKFNGGATLTVALQNGSPAIDAGKNPKGLPFDQRGPRFNREIGSQADIGAFEVQQPTASPPPSPTADPLTVGLFDADSDTLIATLEKGGTTISANQVQGKSLTVAAKVRNDGPDVESVFLNLNGGQVTRIENIEDYSLFGDTQGDYVGGSIPTGQNTISFDLYSKDRLTGDLLGSVDRTFTIADA